MGFRLMGRNPLSMLVVLPLVGLTGLTACGGGAAGGGAPKGDPVAGKALYAQCAGCHSMKENAVGPHHCDLLGRKAGTLPDYKYSEAMAASGLVWDEKTLDEFLTSPISYVTGTNMGFVGFTEAKQRADVIAYIYQANNDPSVCDTH